MNIIEQVAYVIKQLFGAYPNAKITDETTAQYLRLLQDIPPDELQTVVDQCVVDLKFLPTIAEIRDRWHDLTRDPHQLTAAEAWGEVVEAFWADGYVRTPEFSDERITQVVRYMGWQTLCESTNQMADRAHFMRMFDQLTEREQRQNKLLPASRQLVDRHSMQRVGDVIAGMLPQVEQ